MRIGILGSGLMGGKLGTLFARAGHEVVFSYARSRAKLQTLADEAGGSATAGTPQEAAVHEAGRSQGRTTGKPNLPAARANGSSNCR